MKDMYILAIESSCDETSAAIIKNGTEKIEKNDEVFDYYNLEDGRKINISINNFM